MSGETRTSLVFALVAATGSPLEEFIKEFAGLCIGPALAIDEIM